MAKKKEKSITEKIGDFLKWCMTIEYQFGEDAKVITLVKTAKTLIGSCVVAVGIGMLGGAVDPTIEGIFGAIQSWALPLIGASGFAGIEKGSKEKIAASEK